VARKRFVDVICQQVVEYFLLFSDGGLLHVFSTDTVMSLSEEELAEIAGEDEMTKQERERLAVEVETLTKAMKVVRT
jgi:phage terminase Nu1 subunit (DNA packaging protein)